MRRQALSGPLTILLLAAASTFAQGHGYTQAERSEGGKIYRANCIGCHGPEGTSVSGIDLGRGRFHTVSTDEDIVKVIQNGVPGTGMPSTIISHTRAYMIVAYLRTMNDTTTVQSIAAATGDTNRGAALFTGKGGCGACHLVKGKGSRNGPDLSEAGLWLRPIEIETSILDPDAAMPATPPFRVMKKDGAEVSGLLLNQDKYSVQLQSAQGRLVTIPRSNVREAAFVAKSPMPSYRGKLNPQELADLIAYLAAQKGA